MHAVHAQLFNTCESVSHFIQRRWGLDNFEIADHVDLWSYIIVVLALFIATISYQLLLPLQMMIMIVGTGVLATAHRIACRRILRHIEREAYQFAENGLPNPHAYGIRQRTRQWFQIYLIIALGSVLFLNWILAPILLMYGFMQILKEYFLSVTPLSE
jgi:hypothetical protein